ncbi:hypothetical protein PSACC_00661 [Paramicrosporidium saccamoebae]|uniref:UBX domain-containing protein n=1 Tax=Paramicrosporidium saccamoebae TaxID=1246581 RepID=A0A2H9TP38_9FUNG|nr:hypothetical protein PSACC_00661 [Paramicrosporidium saccamoebae]
MSTLTVTVTALDGRAKTTITIPGTCLLKNIVQNACINLKLAATADSPEIDRYGLCHGRATLDLSSSVRLSGLPPGAKLTLVQVSTRESNVLVALQHTVRVTGTFPCSTSLWSILAHFNVGLTAANGIVMAPRLVILGQEYGGLEKLAKVTLRSIGVTGSCLMRVIYKPAEVQSLQEAEAILSKVLGANTVERFVIGAVEPSVAGAVENSVVGTVEPSVIGEAKPPVTNVFIEPSPQVVSTNVSPHFVPAEESPHLNRKFALFTPPNTAVLVQAPDLPDSHYELGETEFRLHLAVTHARTQALVDAPLVSRAKLMEKRQAELLSRYPVARIRFRMPDQHQLEAEFKSTEPASQLYAFVRWAVKTSEEFVLSVGPPPKPIKNDSIPIWQLDLVPAAIVNVAFPHGKVADVFTDAVLSTSRPIPQSSPGATLPGSSTNQPILDSTLTLGSTPTFGSAPTLGSTPTSGSTLPRSSTNQSTLGSSTKKPSWLRL